MSWSGVARAGRVVVAAGAFLLSIGGIGQVFAQEPPAVPSMRILKGELVSPATAATYYGSSDTSTNGLCASFPSNTAICTTERAPEIKELARALRNDPDLIYEYVRNSVDTEFQYGLQKGALGVVIDKSGTPFDQAQLMVELLRQAGYTARFRVGTIELTGAQFQAWTGLSEAKAACEFLALGGIPAIINDTESPTCTFSSSLTKVVLSHAWLEAVIGGTTYQFDPSYKPYTHKPGINVKTGMGFVSGEAMTTAGGTTGTQSTVGYVTALDQSALNTKLQTLSGTLLTRLRQADMQGADMGDVIGGRVIQPLGQRPVGGWRQTSLAYVVTAPITWSGGIPNQYRTKLKLTSVVETGPSTTQTVIDNVFFVDEIYGRNLGIRPKRQLIIPIPSEQQYDPYKWSAEVFLDNVTIATGPQFTDPMDLNLPLTLLADHPFAALSGAYGDATVTKRVNYNLPSIIVHGWGRTSPALSAKWDREEGVEEMSLLPVRLGSRPKTATALETISGKLMRMRIAANWLAQSSVAGELQAELAGGRLTHLHSLGVVTANIRVEMQAMAPPQTGAPKQPYSYQFLDETTVIDLETSLGLTSRTSDAAARRAAIHSIAAISAMLEGSVVEQLTSSPDTVSTARRFSWGNAPEASETPDATSRRTFTFNSGNAANASSVIVAENRASGVWGQFNGQESLQNVDGGKTALANVIGDYADLGFQVTASSEARLGPGFRHGSVFITGMVCTTSCNPIYGRSASRQVGGALVATLYDVAGDPIQISHAVISGPSVYKGGGGSIVKDGVSYDPNKNAQVLKDRFVDRSSALGVNLTTGSPGFDSPVLDSIGNGETPFKLERTIAMRGGGLRMPSPMGTDGEGYPLALTGDTDGVVSNWDSTVSVGGSGLEAFGSSRADAGVQAIVAFTVMQDIWNASPSPKREVTGLLAADWLGRVIADGTLTINQGGDTEQYVRLADGTYASTGGDGRRAVVTGARTAERDQVAGPCHMPGCAYTLETSRFWDGSAVDITAVGKFGDVRDYEFWTVEVVGGSGDHRQGYRLKTWLFPQGVKLTLDYPASGVGALYEIPTKVSSNLGFELNLPALSELTCAEPLIATDKLSGVTKVTFNQPTTRSVMQRPYNFCTMANVFTPVDTVTASLAYSYDTVGRVKEAKDGVAIRQPTVRGPYQFFIADGYRGERQDPEGGRYAVETMADGQLTRNVDELGRVITSTMDGRGRVISRVYPELDEDVFSYDVRDNMVSITRKPKPGSPPGDMVTSVTYVEGSTVWACSNPKTCNRPASFDGPRPSPVVDVVDYSWSSTTGNLTQMLKPADDQGVRPQIDYGYTSYTAGGSTFYLLTSTTEKIDASTTTTTLFDYDAAARYVLKSSKVDDGGLNYVTCYQYDLTGNIVSVSDPRTTTCPSTVQ